MPGQGWFSGGYGGGGFGGFGFGGFGGYGARGLFRPVHGLGDVAHNAVMGNSAGFINATVSGFGRQASREVAYKGASLAHRLFNPGEDEYPPQGYGHHGYRGSLPQVRGFSALSSRGNSYTSGGMAGEIEDDSFGGFVEQKKLQSQSLDKKIEAYVQNNYAELGVERAESYADQVNAAKGDRQALIAIARSVEADVNGGGASQQMVNGFPQTQGGRANQRDSAFQAAFDRIDGIGAFNFANGRLDQSEIDNFARKRPEEFAKIAGVLASKGIHASFDAGYQQPIAYGGNGSRDRANSRDNS